MRKGRFILAMMAVACTLLATSMSASASGVGGGGGTTGGGTAGGGTGYGGSGTGGGGGGSWGAFCSSFGEVNVAWNKLVFGTSVSGAQIDANLYNPVSNPTGTIYAWPVTPWNGGIPGASTGYKDQNGAQYYPWWACVTPGSIVQATPPAFSGFSTYAAAVTSSGILTVDKPTCGTAICQFFVVFDTIQVSAKICATQTPWGNLTPMVVPGGYPVGNTGTAYYSAVAGCPESVTIAGIDVTNTFQYKYTLQWKEVPICGGSDYQWNWGDGSATTCQGNPATHAYTHVYPNGPVTPGSGASVTAKQNWMPVCTAMVLNLNTGAYVTNSPTPGSYACTGTAVITQNLGPTPPHPVLQIEAVPAG